MFQRLHHIAYRSLDAQRTTDFYTRVIGLRFVAGLMPPVGRRPSWPLNEPDGRRSRLVGEPANSIHIFFELGDGSYLAFFDVDAADEPEDPTPWWVKHIAFEVPDMEFLQAAKARLEANGVEVLGPKDHGFCQSVYFNDPDGHRLEMTVRTERPGLWQELAEAAPGALAEWNERKRARGAAPLPPPVTAAAPADRVTRESV